MRTLRKLVAAAPGAPATAVRQPQHAARTLAAQQRAFGSALLAAVGDPGADGRAVAELFTGPTDRVRAGLNAYRNNVLGNWLGALRASYPVLRQLLGEPEFSAAARRYAGEGRSHSGNLDDFGRDFPAWLAAEPAGHALPYLADVGRLEWLLQDVYHAADEAPVDHATLTALAAQPAAAQAALRFRVAAACRVLSSPYPLAAIWRAHQQDPVPAVPFVAGPHHTLILRRAGALAVRAIDPPAAAFLIALRDGAPLAAAHAAALGADPQASAGQLLGACLHDGLLVGVAPEFGDHHGPHLPA